MQNLHYAVIMLIALAALAFVLAVLSNLGVNIVGATAEGFSRACSNLALIAIALGIWFREPSEL